MSQSVTRAEVAKHNQKESGWIIVNNGVYDVSKFFDDHPGGRDILLAHIGTDSTDGFEAVGHSRGAMRKLADLKVGELPAAEQRKFITFKEVVQHKEPTSCWIAIHNKVYDVTAFLDNHPGGRDILLYNAGGDASEQFDGIGHSAAAQKMMGKYCIGDIDVAERTARGGKGGQKGGGPAAEATAEELALRRTGNESLLARMQEQLMLFMIVGVFLASAYLCLG